MNNDTTAPNDDNHDSTAGHNYGDYSQVPDSPTAQDFPDYADPDPPVFVVNPRRALGPAGPSRSSQDEVKVVGQSIKMPKRNKKFKNPFYKPKRIKFDTTVVIPSDQDETEIEEVIQIESSEEEEGANEPIVNHQPTPPVVLNLPSIENEEEFNNGINYQSTPLHSPIFSNPPRYITIGK